MFRVEMRDATNAVVMKLDGRFTGEYAEYTRSLVKRGNPDMKLVVDLTEVTAVDSVGEEVLLFFGQLEAKFIADNLYARYVCEQLHLPCCSAGTSYAQTRRRSMIYAASD